jgi:hypothetical protein
MHPKEALVVSDKRGERIHTFPYYISYSIMLPKRRGGCKVELWLIHPVEVIHISVLQIDQLVNGFKLTKPTTVEAREVKKYMLGIRCMYFRQNQPQKGSARAHA